MRPIALASLATTLGGCAGLLGFESPNHLTVEQLDVAPGQLAPAFDPGVTDYTLAVPYGTAGLEITAVSSSPTAAMTIDGAPLTGHVPLTVAPAGELALVATSTSGVSVTYTIHVEAAAFGIDFAPVVKASANGMSNHIAAGDLDGDGAADLVVTNIGGSQLSLLRSNGTGGFTSGAMPGAGDAIALGRLDSDPNLDLVVGGGALSRALGDGTGAFGSFASAINASISVYSVAIADFDGDHHADIAFGGSGVVRVQLGDGAGGFSNGPITSGPSVPSQLVVGDFDGNGTPDIAAADPAAGLVWIHLNPGTAAFAARAITVGSDGAASLAAADFDGDGRTDLAVTQGQTNAIELLTAIGADDEHHAQVPAGTQPASVVAGDFDADGHVDLAVANSAGAKPTLTILRGDGTGRFTGKAFAVEMQARHLVAADFNKDGHADLAYTTTSSTVCVLLVKP